MNKELLLKKHFGYDTFRFGQEGIIDEICSGRDALAIMPTGGGKSLCYQIPALLLEGVSIVISPLIALMKDQVDGLNENGIPATFLNSTLSADEARQRQSDIIDGVYRIIYVAPERLLTDSFYTLCKHININFVAIDEAHCISQWGHDFRPSYKAIPKFIKQLDDRPIIAAFTATATAFVIDEIKILLELKNPYELIAGFDRPNLLYKIVKPTDKYKYLKNYIDNDFSEGSGIIYCSTRKTVESLSNKLKEQGILAEGYHGGMDSEKRTIIQDGFMKDDIKVMVATNAFGMGIDKPDVRFVVHYNMPKNMEAYYQEAGRAGRDGINSECILMYSPADIVKQKLMISQNSSTIERDRIQYENLQTLVNYCHTNDCLRNEIRHYFGEVTTQTNCASCGNCLDDSEFVDMTLEAQKIMSCVFRTGQRFGLNTIIQVLRGSKNKKIMDWKLNEVSTYGIIMDMSEGGLRELSMNLIARGYIAMTTDTFPILKLQETSRDILKGHETVLVRKERINVQDKKKKTTKRKTVLEVDTVLLDQLLEHRKEIAAEKGVPLYVIFHNTALEEMAYYLPQEKQSFLEIKGVGEKKFDSYGAGFIELIKDYVSENKISTEVIETRVQQMTVEVEVERKPSEGKNRYKLTLEVYYEGLDLEEIAERRGLSPSTIVNHFKKIESEGTKIEWDRFLSKDAEEELLTIIEEVGVGALKPIKEKASENITYSDIHLVLAKHFSEE